MLNFVSRIFDFLTHGFVKLSTNPCVVIRSDVRALKGLFIDINQDVDNIINMNSTIKNKRKEFEICAMNKKNRVYAEITFLNRRFAFMKKRLLSNLCIALSHSETIVINTLAVSHRHLNNFNRLSEIISRLDDKKLKEHLNKRIREEHTHLKKIVHEAFLGSKALERRVFSRETFREWSLQGIFIKLKRIRKTSVDMDTARRHIKKQIKKFNGKNFEDILKLLRHQSDNIDKIILKDYQFVHKLQKIVEHIKDEETEKKFKITLDNLIVQTRRASEEIK